MDNSCTNLKTPFQARLLLLLSFFLFLSSHNIAAAEQDGEKLFKQNCATCHRTDKTKLTGPGLEGVFTRVPQPAEEWLLKWVKDNDKLRKSGDAYANKIYEENNKTAMTVFSYLKDDEIKAILTYVKNPPPPPVAAGQKNAEGGKAEATNENTLLYIVLGLGALFLILINVLGSVRNSLQKLANEKAGLPEPPDLNLWLEIKYWIKGHKKTTAFGVFLFILWLLVKGYIGLMGIGVYQNYQPVQPIAFSHKLHAGDNAINCVYCHSGAERGKTAGIPSANVCMNCHKAVQSGPSGTKEIAKIYAALDYNPEKQTYGNNPKPIKWVRVHALPDFAYFNHSQHVVVGGVECKTCHGPVDSMAVMKQYSELTMKWCIECHRTREVQTAGNGYYDEILKRHKGDLNGKKITVEKLGGTECAKCHY